MWLDYIRERMPEKQVLQIEDVAFSICYPYEAENSLYMEEIYVKPSHRRSKVGEKLLSEVVNLAKDANFKYIMGSIDPTTANTDISLKAMLKNNFKPYRIDNGLLFLRMEI